MVLQGPLGTRPIWDQTGARHRSKSRARTLVGIGKSKRRSTRVRSTPRYRGACVGSCKRGLPPQQPRPFVGTPGIAGLWRLSASNAPHLEEVASWPLRSRRIRFPKVRERDCREHKQQEEKELRVARTAAERLRAGFRVFLLGSHGFLLDFRSSATIQKCVSSSACRIVAVLCNSATCCDDNALMERDPLAQISISPCQPQRSRGLSAFPQWR